MKYTDIPTKFVIPFADSAGAGYTREVPTDSQIGIHDGWASLETGFPPLNFLPIGAGGVPPFGQDMNGLMNQATAWNRWQGAGSPLKYDAGFQTDIGGYPKGAMLAQAANNGQFWISNVDDNTSNPDTGGANWINFPLDLIGKKGGFAGNYQVYATAGSFSWTVPTGVTRVLVQLWGGGGSGGGQSGGNGHGGSGGGGGGCASKVISGLTPGASIAVVVGAGGAGVTGALAGNNGGTSSFNGSAVTAVGGRGGNYGSTGTYQAGTGTIGQVVNNSAATGVGGDVNLEGGRGMQGGVCWISNVFGIGGMGGAAAGSGGNGGPGTTGDGNTGTVPGGGGSGAGGGNAGSSTSGGGAGGMVIIQWVDPT